MSTPTTNMALLQATDADDTEHYLVTDLPTALVKVDGHHHGGGTDGLPVRAVTATLRVQQKQGADVVSAGSLTLGTDGNTFNLTGGTTLNLLDSTGWQAGSVVNLIFATVTTVTHNMGASGAFLPLILAGGATVAMHSNATLTLVLTAANLWREVSRMNSVDSVVYSATVAPSARYYRSTNQSIPNNTMTQVTLDTATFDSDTMTSAAGLLTCKTAGLYLIVGHLEWLYNATGDRGLILQVNGANEAQVYGAPTPLGLTTDQCVSTLVRLAVNDTIKLNGYQTSGGALNVGGGAVTTFLEAVRLSA